MKLSQTSSVSFPAGHQTVTGDCSKGAHGHTWTISVTASQIHDWRPVADLGREFAYRDFNEMAQGTEPTPVGLAAYFLERLRMPIPDILRVEVSFEGQSGRAEK